MEAHTTIAAPELISGLTLISVSLFEGFRIELSSQGLYPFYGVEAPVGTFGADQGRLDPLVQRVQFLSVNFLTFVTEINIFHESVMDIPESRSIFRALWTHIEQSLLLPCIEPRSGNRSEHAQIAPRSLWLKLCCRSPRLCTA